MPHPNLDPQLAAGWAALDLPAVDLQTADLAEVRATRRAWVVPAEPDDIAIEDRLVPGPPGAPDVRVRLYLPHEGERPLPCLYWIHGGGMVMGSPEADDHFMVQIIREVGCAVVSVDYRLAPENPYPAPQEDCYAGLVWTAKNAAELGLDPGRIAVGGASAGGGLAAATVLMARDRGGPAIAFQLLECPMLDDRNVTPSSAMEYDDALVWSRSNNLFGWRALLGDLEEVPPYAAPARAEDLSGLPRTFIDVGELEVFRDECIDYAARLVRAGVSTEFHLYPGAFHGFDAFVPEADVSRRALATRLAALRQALRRDG
ncbi:alpha/beta hydrolase [Thermoactinospora rubra]|uniref:alpha/beta hydrolase n=1 Tax=Thermoactinospora rubra TaxID=1088767 RepID=UPI000A0FF3E8|nr:alpha/beta hydrolase [Thermoactinospora rubra]